MTANISFFPDARLRQTNQLETLFRLARSITACSNPETLYQTMLTYVQLVSPCEQAVIYRVQEDEQQLQPVTRLLEENLPDKTITDKTIKIDDEAVLPAWAALHRHSMLRAPQAPGIGQAELAVPFIAKNVLYGVLWMTRAAPFSSDEFRQMRHLGTMAAAALEHMALSQQIQEKQEEMKRMQARFLSTIGHELRAPINTINGYLDLLLEGMAGELDEQQHEFIQRARSGSEHLYALLENLLLISRADAGQLYLNQAIIRLPEVIENAVEEMELTARDNDLTVEVEIAPNLPRLYADTIRLQQALRNLLSNALRFTPTGGRVTISARLAEPSIARARIDGDIDEEERHVELVVSDTGIGIAPEKLQRIFERFFQITAEESRGRASGQGLGLAIVKMIIELHGGSVTVESQPEKGSAFICTLPCLLT
jgi:signal transduction histidine kinase